MKVENVSCCPLCGSSKIEKQYIFSSIYGSIPERPRDFCLSCGFKSDINFDKLNFINIRNIKIEQILNKDGIQ